jgi:hypothetical protein
MQIGEAAVDQRADEIDGERRAFVAAQQQLRIRLARGGGEVGAVDDVATVGRQASRHRGSRYRPNAASRTARPCVRP